MFVNNGSADPRKNLITSVLINIRNADENRTILARQSFQAFSIKSEASTPSRGVSDFFPTADAPQITIEDKIEYTERDFIYADLDSRF